MFKVFAVAAVLGSISTYAALPGSDTFIASSDPVSIIATGAEKAHRLASEPARSIHIYVSPRLKNHRVDFCLSSSGRCGREAADAFCRKSGFKEAMNFQRSSALPRATKLGFRQIKCWKPTETTDARKTFVVGLIGKSMTLAHLGFTTNEEALSHTLHGQAAPVKLTITNLTVLSKNQAFPLKSQMTMEPCTLRTCFEI